MFNFWWSAERSKQKMSTEMQKNKKDPLSHRKIKCSFLDYVQLLMISRANQGKKDDQDAKKWKRSPKSSQKIKCLFFNYINFWWSAEQSKQKTLTKTKRSLSHWKIKCLFLDYVQLLMISWAIWANNIDQNAKKIKRAA